MMRGRFREFEDALIAFPATARVVGGKLSEPDGPAQLARLLGLLLALLAVGWIAEKISDRMLRAYRMRLRQTVAATCGANAFRVLMLLLLDVVGIAVFGLAAFGAFVLWWPEHNLQRSALLQSLIAVVMVLVTALFARFLLVPDGTSNRLLPFADAPARTLRRFAVTIAGVYGVLLVATSVLRDGGASAATVDIVLLASVALLLALLLWAVWRVRVPIAELIRGEGEIRRDCRMARRSVAGDRDRRTS